MPFRVSSRVSSCLVSCLVSRCVRCVSRFVSGLVSRLVSRLVSSRLLLLPSCTGEAKPVRSKQSIYLPKKPFLAHPATCQKTT